MLRLTASLLIVIALASAQAAAAGDGRAAPALGAPDPVSALARPLASKPAPPLPLGTRAAAFARNLLGVQYRYGGASPDSGFDCSGLVQFVYRHFGVDLPHASYAQFDLGLHVSRVGLRPGDLVFFNGAGHVGIYIGDDSFIHAPHAGAVVQISSLAGWSGGFDGGRRVTR